MVAGNGWNEYRFLFLLCFLISERPPKVVRLSFSSFSFYLSFGRMYRSIRQRNPLI